MFIVTGYAGFRDRFIRKNRFEVAPDRKGNVPQHSGLVWADPLSLCTKYKSPSGTGARRAFLGSLDDRCRLFTPIIPWLDPGWLVSVNDSSLRLNVNLVNRRYCQLKSNRADFLPRASNPNAEQSMSDEFAHSQIFGQIHLTCQHPFNGKRFQTQSPLGRHLAWVPSWGASRNSRRVTSLPLEKPLRLVLC